jgi:hypothetical protein
MTENTRAQNPAIDRAGTLAFFADHPGVWVAGLYMVGSTIGMLDSWWFLHQFGINVFLYSDVAHFLLASFREPGGWLVIAWTAIVVIGDYSSSLRVARSGSRRWWLRWYGSRRYRQFGWVFGVVVTVVYIAIFAGGRANAIYDGRRGKEVRVTLGALHAHEPRKRTPARRPTRAVSPAMTSAVP